MLSITTFTTEDEILAPVAAAKQALIESATEALTSDYLKGSALVGRAQNVASAEAVAQAQFRYLRSIKADPVSALFTLAEISLELDDTSSGRGNDSRRSSRDAVAAWVRHEINNIKYGS